MIVAAGAILFVNVLSPVCESLGGLIQSAINKKVYKWQLDMQLDNAETQAAAEVIQPNTNNMTQAIGFELPTQEVESW